MDGCCDHCGKPLGDVTNVIAYEGHRFHKKCAIASESGEIPPVSRDSGGYGLWAISTSFGRREDATR